MFSHRMTNSNGMMSAFNMRLQYGAWLQQERQQQLHYQQQQQQQQPIEQLQRELHHLHQQEQQQQLLRYAIESEQMARSYSPWTMPFQGLSYPQQLWASGRPRADDSVRRYSNSSSDSSNDISSSNNSSHTTSLVSSSNSGSGSEDGQKESDKVRHSDTGSVTARVTDVAATQTVTGEALRTQTV